MNQPDPTETTRDFDGCRRDCRLAQAHTLVWGECEHAPKPEPTVNMSKVYTAGDGYPAIGFDTYTVPELARLIEPVAGDPLRAAAAARAIVHRNDEQPPAAPVVPPAPASRTVEWPAAAAVVEAMNEGCGQSRPCASCDAREDAAAELRRLAAVPAAAEEQRSDAGTEFVQQLDQIDGKALDAVEADLAAPPDTGDDHSCAESGCTGEPTAAEEQPESETPCGPTPDVCDGEAGEPCANHEREAAHAEGEHCFCGPECETPDAPPREPHPTEADQRHALTLLARVQGRDAAGPTKEA